MPSTVNSYPIGNTVRLTASFTDLSGAPVDPGQVACKVLSPSAVQSAPSVTRDETGQYHADVPIPLDKSSTGVWSYRFEATGTSPAGGEYYFRVPESAFYS